MNMTASLSILVFLSALLVSLCSGHHDDTFQLNKGITNQGTEDYEQKQFGLHDRDIGTFQYHPQVGQYDSHVGQYGSPVEHYGSQSNDKFGFSSSQHDKLSGEDNKMDGCDHEKFLNYQYEQFDSPRDQIGSSYNTQKDSDEVRPETWGYGGFRYGGYGYGYPSYGGYRYGYGSPYGGYGYGYPSYGGYGYGYGYPSYGGYGYGYPGGYRYGWGNPWV